MIDKFEDLGITIEFHFEDGDFKTLKLKHDHGMINRGLPFEEIISFVTGRDDFFGMQGSPDCGRAG